MRNRILFSFLAWVAVIVSVQGKQKDFVLQSGRPVAIACSGSEAPVVRTSLDLLSRDLQTVLSATAHIDTNTGNIIVGTIGQSKLIEQAGIDISALKNKMLLLHKAAYPRTPYHAWQHFLQGFLPPLLQSLSLYSYLRISQGLPLKWDLNNNTETS